MPLVRLEVRQGRSATQKQALLDVAHAALVEALGIPDHDRMQRIVERPREDFELPPGSSDDFVLVEVTMFAGRSRQAKRRLYQALVRNFGTLGVTRPMSWSCCTSRRWTTGVSAGARWPARWTWGSKSKSDQHHARRSHPCQTRHRLHRSRPTRNYQRPYRNALLRGFGSWADGR